MTDKKELINIFLYDLQYLSRKNNLDQKQVHLQLINYGVPKREQLKKLEDKLSIILSKYIYDKKINIQEQKHIYFVEKKYQKETPKYKIKINVSLKEQNIERTLIKIIEFLKKKKIQYKMKISKVTKADMVVISVETKKEADIITNFINNDREITENLNQNNPFYFNDNKINFCINNPLQYNEILSKYIYNYINSCNKTNKKADIEGFTQFLYLHMMDFISNNDLSKELKIIDEKEIKPVYLQFLEEITNLFYINLKAITYNQNSKDVFYEQLESMKYSNKIKKNNKNYEKITTKNFEQDSKLLEEIIITMTKIYGYEHTKQAILGYKESGITSSDKRTTNVGVDSSKYITQNNGLRQRVEESKTFRTYLNLFTEEELIGKIKKIAPKLTSEQNENVKTTNEMILEQVCKETYLSCQTKERRYSGKNQVAMALIRMKNNNYDCITRNNNAREIAKSYINPEEVEKIIKKTLETNGYLIEHEEDLYELYATHIEYLCEKRVVRKAR